MADTVAGDMRINASPTKEFFIHMLTRDVQLSRALIDLVDNCIDGAQRLRADARYDGLWVRIELGADAFRISDNCGGIPVKIARDYAFRFGRPKEASATPHSVGLFGVGMKRTFFKLGEEFSVASICRTEEFTLKVNVRDWIAEQDRGPDDWHFAFATLNQNRAPISDDETGTSIAVTALHPAVSETLRLNNFHQQLASELADAHAASIERGLAITVNQVPVNYQPQRLLVSDTLQPAFVQHQYPRKGIDGKDGEPVLVKLYAGISTRDFHEGGWYVFCNGRLVLKADKTSATVWGKAHGTRQYHADFAFFRGYAFFDCIHSTLLPWTTTKTGVDLDSPLYKTVQREMIEVTKPILAFLIESAEERGGQSEDDSLDEAIKNAKATKVDGITAPMPFRAPTLKAKPTGPPVQWIRYRKPLADVERAKALLHATTFMEVGERTFDYFLKYEGEEE
jgi:hypothetical protein